MIKTHIKKIALQGCIVLSCTFICLHCTNTGPEGNRITPDEIIGNWVLTMYEEEVREQIDGITETDKSTDYFHDTSRGLIVVDDSTMQFYSREHYCFTLREVSYRLTDNQLYGNEFNGVDISGTIVEKWQTFVRLWDSQLILEYHTDYTGTNREQSKRERYYFDYFSRNFPPDDWPDELCQ
jgi:hypothetical protein